METVSSILSGVICPLILIIAGVAFGFRLRFFYLFHPIKLIKSISSREGGPSVKHLCLALAGTLGVGNMAGVSTAIISGGAGALFWMNASAVCAMSIKYIEVRLAMKTRVLTDSGYVGGAMYYIRRISPALAAAFAVMCAANSLLTGNIVQVSAAAETFQINPLFVGIAIGLPALWVSAGGGKRIADICGVVIPAVTAVYLIVTLYIIGTNIEKVPDVVKTVMENAFSLKSVGGGFSGFAVSRAVRFGITRGIFSNEAGSGTSPIAHSMAETENSHSQACLGIVEVFIDTTLLCSLTGAVILIYGGEGDGIALVIRAYTALAGEIAGRLIALSVPIFAFSTVICQSSYGLASARYLGLGTRAEVVYLLMVFASSVIGSVIDTGVMWALADIIISLMTVINIVVIVQLSKKGSLY